MSTFNKYMNIIQESKDIDIDKIADMLTWNSITAYAMAFSVLPKPEKGNKDEIIELFKNKKFKNAIINLNKHSGKHNHGSSKQESPSDDLFNIYEKMYTSYSSRD